MLSRVRAEEWYARPEVAEALLAQISGRTVAFRMCGTEEGEFPYRRRSASGAPLAVREGQWPKWVRAGIAEVHREEVEGGMLRALVVDLDPPERMGGEPLVEAQAQVAALFDRHFPVTHIETRFSGNRSLHVLGFLPAPMAAEAVRAKLVTLCRKLPPPATLDGKREGIFVDLGAMQPRHPLRCLGSLHHKSAKVCVRFLEGEEIAARLAESDFASIAHVATSLERIEMKGREHANRSVPDSPPGGV